MLVREMRHSTICHCNDHNAACEGADDAMGRSLQMVLQSGMQRLMKLKGLCRPMSGNDENA